MNPTARRVIVRIYTSISALLLLLQADGILHRSAIAAIFEVLSIAGGVLYFATRSKTRP